MRRIFHLFACLLILSSLPTITRAQETTATVVGTVTDESAGSLPGVTVVLKHLGTGQTFQRVTSAEGLYTARVRSSQQGEGDNANRRVAIVVDRTPPGISNPVVLPNSIVSGSNTAVTLTATSTDPTASGVDAGNYKVLSADYRIDRIFVRNSRFDGNRCNVLTSCSIA